MIPTATVILKSGRDKSVRQRHPRLFSGGIKEIAGKPRDGDVVDVADNHGEWLARGIINQQAQCAVRLMTWDKDETIDDALWQRRIAQAVARRNADPLLRTSNARRVVFGESDGLPGVVVDDYAGHLVLQISTLAAFRARQAVIDGLVIALQPHSISERSDEERAKHEAIKAFVGVVHGTAPDGAIDIHEHGFTFAVRPGGGQKTGFYCDQRMNRLALERYVQPGGSVLNAFSYTGGFGLYAARAGAARIVNTDISADALAQARENFVRNNLSLEGVEFACADAFDDLRTRRKAGEQFDVVILDPPKFASSPAHIDRAARAYKDLSRVGFSLLKPGGVLATFSCSGVIDPSLFQQIVFAAAVEANRDAQIVEKLSQASDHPILLTFPESEYLKGLVCRMM